eukprot:15011544-Heterocapsa_arctica.AAC.1
MTSRVATVFDALAKKLNVDDSCELVLEEWGVVNADEFYFRLPSSDKLESCLEERIFPMIGSRRDDGSIEVYEKDPDELTPLLRREWMRGSTAASLRRLWEASKSAAKRDLEKLTEERPEGEAPKRMTAARIADFASKARARGGMPELSDLERPGPTTLAKVADNYRFGGAFRY